MKRTFLVLAVLLITFSVMGAGIKTYGPVTVSGSAYDWIGDKQSILSLEVSTTNLRTVHQKGSTKGAAGTKVAYGLIASPVITAPATPGTPPYTGLNAPDPTMTILGIKGTSIIVQYDYAAGTTRFYSYKIDKKGGNAKVQGSTAASNDVIAAASPGAKKVYVVEDDGAAIGVPDTITVYNKKLDATKSISTNAQANSAAVLLPTVKSDYFYDTAPSGNNTIISINK